MLVVIVNRAHKVFMNASAMDIGFNQVKIFWIRNCALTDIDQKTTL
jgi:hypothetical protein